MLAEHPTLTLSDRAVFVRNLCFVHGLIVASEDLLREAAMRSTGRLQVYYERHLAEERGHVEMLEEDLAYLGVTPELDHRAAMLAGSQYYLIRHFGSQLLLGYIHVLESRAPTPEMVANLTELYGERATRFLDWHARHDPEHARQIEEEIGMLQDPAPVWDNALSVSQALAAFLPQLERA